MSRAKPPYSATALFSRKAKLQLTARHDRETREGGLFKMIITDPALIALQSSLSTFKRVRPRPARLRFWARPPAAPKFGTEAYYVNQRVSFADADLAAAATDSGGSRIHATTRTSINRG